MGWLILTTKFHSMKLKGMIFICHVYQGMCETHPWYIVIFHKGRKEMLKRIPRQLTVARGLREGIILMKPVQ